MPHTKGRARQGNRRGAILRALYDCISTMGYANTTLRDVAAQAEMSPSHVGYYFENKGAILERYAEVICDGNITALPALSTDTDPAQLADDLADFCLGPGQMNAALLGVIQELSGLAVHDERLHEIKSRHSNAWRHHLEEFFTIAPPVAGFSAREAAWLTYSMLIGLNTNMVFDPALRRKEAHQTFRRALRSMIGVSDDVQPASQARKRSRRRRNQRGDTQS